HERQRAEEQSEQEESEKRRSATRGELRQETREEHRHLRVAEVAHDALTEREPRPHLRPGSTSYPGDGRLVANRAEQRLRAEKDEVRGSQDLQRNESRLRRNQKRRQAGARRNRPDGLARRDAGRGKDPAPAAADERVPDRQGRVLSGRDDHEGGDAQERGQLTHRRVVSLGG